MFRDFTLNQPEVSQFTLTVHSEENRMSITILIHWVSHADDTAMDEFFGLVKTDHDANFYYGVIVGPQLRVC